MGGLLFKIISEFLCRMIGKGPEGIIEGFSNKVLIFLIFLVSLGKLIH